MSEESKNKFDYMEPVRRLFEHAVHLICSWLLFLILLVYAASHAFIFEYIRDLFQSHPGGTEQVQPHQPLQEAGSVLSTSRDKKHRRRGKKPTSKNVNQANDTLSDVELKEATTNVSPKSDNSTQSESKDTKRSICPCCNSNVSQLERNRITNSTVNSLPPKEDKLVSPSVLGEQRPRRVNPK